MKFEYWYYYSSEDFGAEVIKATVGWRPEDDDVDYCGHYHGPFSSITEARALVLAKVNGDIDEFKRMASHIRGKPTLRIKK